MSDYHEMATHLKMEKARTLHIKSPAFIFDNGGRRLGIERRQFDYSHYFPERRVSRDRRNRTERRIDRKLNS
jgi:hypothetical protein